MLLVGSFFTMEYSIESAALFNPSIVQHPDQSGLEAGQKRVIISFRATGESHISSIVFRSGIIDKDMNLILDTPGNYVSEAETIKDHVYDKKEFELLYLLAQKPGKVFLRNEILSSVWGNDVIVGDRTIDVHIRKIRSKLGLDCITTVKGVGYKFEL